MVSKISYYQKHRKLAKLDFIVSHKIFNQFFLVSKYGRMESTQYGI